MKNNDSFLTLVPSPLDEQGIFDVVLKNLVSEYETNKVDYLVLVESEKIARRRWINSGLARELITKFRPYHEQNQLEFNTEIIDQMLKLQRRFILISDEGLPAFFDPGQMLISLMHQKGLKLNCLNFPCSAILALTLSGFDHSQFRMVGFPPVKTPERLQFLMTFIEERETAILMDTAYRLELTLKQILTIESEKKIKNSYFLALDLGREKQDYIIGSIEKLIKICDFTLKKDFVLVKGSNEHQKKKN